MKSILFLFGDVSGYLALLSMLFPIIASIIVRTKKVTLTQDMRVFEGIVYFTLLAQITSHYSWFGLTDYKNIILTIYLTTHLGIFSYLLIRWSGIFRNTVYLAFAVTIIPLLILVFFGEKNLYAEIMFWFNTFILLFLSFYLSYLRDRKDVRINCEYNFIHYGIYVSTVLTILGISLPKLDIIFFGVYIHTLANIACNIYFARSFICLYR